MIEVGLEFTIDKQNLSGYGKDFLIAMTAATFPWLFCGVYFWLVFDLNWRESALVSLFSAPTSAGVLFAMLAAAGLGMTWLFKKARILAIADDIGTLLLMVPFQMAYMGVKWQSFIAIGSIVILLFLAYRLLHRWQLPTRRCWFIIYGIIITLICEILESQMDIHLAVIIPSFAFGCILYNPHHSETSQNQLHEHQFIEPIGKADRIIDNFIKAAFMFLVGCSLPKIQLQDTSIWYLLIHIIVLTILSNLGKLVPFFCYKTEASLRERLALSIALFPRGEVGAGILILSLGYGLKGSIISLAGLSLALNLVLTGVFISLVIFLLKESPKKAIPAKK